MGVVGCAPCNSKIAAQMPTVSLSVGYFQLKDRPSALLLVLPDSDIFRVAQPAGSLFSKGRNAMR
jgi:hypothetical protein